MDYYFQLNTKYGLSLQRAEYLFNDLSGKQPWYFDNYLKNICGMSAEDVIETKWNFLYHVMEILTRNDFWEVYTEAEVQNWQSTYEVCKTLQWESSTTVLYDHGRFAPINGVKFGGDPAEYPFTPYEIEEQTYWRLSQQSDLNNLDFTRRAHMMELITMLPDAFVGGCGRYMMRLITGGHKSACPAGICRRCRAIINLNNYICPSCSCS